ncbi:hypothetical protein ACUMKS_003540 [Proteus mirabilis]|uniref:hypothetical protein n=1 Tax=Proteus mirabilis TaxID=584 RepID=UPI001A1FBF8C|nr:hypothetical protein [Proteus mirabilis]HEM8286021.1 hypothetical protein [Providencia stuartii]EKV7963180.1 hypothetical protein [Proteus mirabilis]ELB1171909.1 hypothetical protein [Proteus mirabilis]ELB2631268.1 hypothetical protein [Proteus mirabilis]MBI6253050.1 hypothetical protein [Proteus mirabilis]
MNKNQQNEKCSICGIQTDAIYEIADGDNHKLLCLLCLEQEEDIIPSDSTVGFYGVKNNTRENFALLKRAIIKALASKDKKLENKAKLILKKLDESSNLVLNLYGSISKEDLKTQVRQQKELVIINSDSDIIKKIQDEKDSYPDFSEWENISSSYEGDK